MSSTPPLSPEQRAQMEQAYAQMLSAVVQMARVLGRPAPIVTRAERRLHPPKPPSDRHS